MTETKITGKKYRVWNGLLNKWERLSFWTKASDVENEAGLTLEETVGEIKGITASLAESRTGYAADATAVKTLDSKFGGCRFVQCTQADYDRSAKENGTIYFITD